MLQVVTSESESKQSAHCHTDHNNNHVLMAECVVCDKLVCQSGMCGKSTRRMSASKPPNNVPSIFTTAEPSAASQVNAVPIAKQRHRFFHPCLSTGLKTRCRLHSRFCKMVIITIDRCYDIPLNDIEVSGIPPLESNFILLPTCMCCLLSLF